MKVVTLECMEKLLKLKSIVAANVFLFLLEKKNPENYASHMPAGYRQELMEKYHLSSPQVTHAIKVLKENGFITGEKGGYELTPEVIDGSFGIVDELEWDIVDYSKCTLG